MYFIQFLWLIIFNCYIRIQSNAKFFHSYTTDFILFYYLIKM